MNSYVLSAKNDTGCPIGLAEDYGLFERFHIDVKIARKGIGSLPWYSDPKDCKLPKNACYITKLTKFDFAIRRINSGLYIANDDFYCVMKRQKSTYDSAEKISVKNKQGNDVTNRDYFLIRIPYFSSMDAIDRSKSKFLEDDGDIVLNRLVTKSSFSESLFFIDGLAAMQSTLFCSESFRDDAIQVGIKGVNFFEETKAKWQSGFDYLLNMGKKEPANTVWPI